MRETLVKSEEFKDSPVGRIPKDWDVKTLGELGNFQNGLNKGKKDFGFGTKFVNILDVYPQRLNIRVLGRMNASQSEISSYQLEVGDILLDRSSVKLDGVGYPTVFEGADEPIIFCGFIIRFRLSTSAVKPRFLCELMRDEFFRNRIFQIATRSANVNVNQEQLAKLWVAFPPVSEQEQIIEILNTIDEAIAHTSSLIAKLKQMKAGLLHDLLTRGLDENGELRDAIGHPEQFKDSPLGQIPKDWEVLPLQNFTLSSAFGPRFSGNAYDADGNVATLRTTDMDDEGNLNLSTMPLARLNLDLYRSHFLEIGDLLVSRSGTCGITAVFPGFDIPVLPGAFVIRFRFKNGLLSEFVRRYFNWETGRERVLREAEGGVQKNLRGSTLLKLLIPVPVEAEQREILRRLDTHESRICTEEAYRDKLKLQKQGLMHNLLTGKVRVKNA
jgi:type I restriction enzyme S subunit